MSSSTPTITRPRDLLRIVFRHKAKAKMFFVVTLALVVVGVTFWPRRYVSEGKLFVRLGRESVALDPTATVGELVSINESREHEINSILEVLKSRALAEKVVEQLGADTILAKDDDFGPQFSPLSWLKGLLSEPISDGEKAITELETSVHFMLAKKSSVITVRCKSKSPELAQKIVAAYLDTYPIEHVRANRTAGSHDFFANQSKMLAGQLETATETLRDAKNEMGLASIAGQRKLLESQIGVIDGHAIENATALVAAEARSKNLEQSINQLPKRVLTDEESGHPNAATDLMRRQLYDLQIQERELLARLTEEHPLVKAKREQVKEAQKIFSQQTSERTRTKSSVNTSRQALELELLTQQSQMAALQSRADELTNQKALAQKRLEALNHDEVRFARLQRDVEILGATYRIHAEKLEQARIDEALESQRISNVNIVQAASFVAKPVSPKVTLVLLLGFMAATFGSVGVALLAESWDQTLKTPADVEQQIDVPVLVTIPRVARNRVLMN